MSNVRVTIETKTTITYHMPTLRACTQFCEVAHPYISGFVSTYSCGDDNRVIISPPSGTDVTRLTQILDGFLVK